MSWWFCKECLYGLKNGSDQAKNQQRWRQPLTQEPQVKIRVQNDQEIQRIVWTLKNKKIEKKSSIQSYCYWSSGFSHNYLENNTDKLLRSVFHEKFKFWVNQCRNRLIFHSKLLKCSSSKMWLSKIVEEDPLWRSKI